jgi:hypothetical protein
MKRCWRECICAAALVLAANGTLLMTGCGGGTPGQGAGTQGGPVAPVAPTPSPTTPQAPTGGAVSMLFLFKLDPLLRGGGTYGGDVWVSPPTYRFSQVGRTAVVDVRAEGLDASRQSVSINPKWTSGNTRLVSVSPGQGREVRITVQAAGETRLQVDAAGILKILIVRAAYQNDAMQVEISQ